MNDSTPLGPTGPEQATPMPTPIQPSLAQRPAKRRSMKTAVLTGALVLIVCGSTGFLGGWLGSSSENKQTTIEKQQIILKTQGQVIAQLAKDVGPSVVSVVTTSKSTSTNIFSRGAATEQQAAGTGIILSEDGLIITNRHVAPAGTTNVNITLSDGTEYEDVTVIGRTNENDSLDIAFLKIKDTKGKKLTAAKIGDSSASQVGDPVVAIGNALGQFENTVTSGIVSGFGRSIQASNDDGSSVENLENLFQTDAAINQGNSGGPLINLDGQVIGINTAIAESGTNIGFAIPINDVKGLIKSVEEKGKLERPYLGVVYIPITADVAKQYSLSSNTGAYVLPEDLAKQDPVINGGPADKAGIQPGDIITKVDNDVIDASHSLTSLLGKHSVGDKVTLTVLRDSKQRTIDATLGAAPSS